MANSHFGSQHAMVGNLSMHSCALGQCDLRSQRRHRIHTRRCDNTSRSGGQAIGFARLHRRRLDASREWTAPKTNVDRSIDKKVSGNLLETRKLGQMKLLTWQTCLTLNPQPVVCWTLVFEWYVMKVVDLKMDTRKRCV